MIYEEFPETLIVGLSTTCASSFSPDAQEGTNQIMALWERIRALDAELHPDEENPLFGVSGPADEHVPPLSVWYTAGFVGTEPLDGLDSIVVPAGKYLVYSHQGTPDTFDDAIRFAYMENFPKSGSPLRDAPHLERYRHHGSPVDNVLTIDIMIPVN